MCELLVAHVDMMVRGHLGTARSPCRAHPHRHAGRLVVFGGSGEPCLHGLLVSCVVDADFAIRAFTCRPLGPGGLELFCSHGTACWPSAMYL